MLSGSLEQKFKQQKSKFKFTSRESIAGKLKGYRWPNILIAAKKILHRTWEKIVKAKRTRTNALTHIKRKCVGKRGIERKGEILRMKKIVSNGKRGSEGKRE